MAKKMLLALFVMLLGVAALLAYSPVKEKISSGKEILLSATVDFINSDIGYFDKDISSVVNGDKYRVDFSANDLGEEINALLDSGKFLETSCKSSSYRLEIPFYPQSPVDREERRLEGSYYLSSNELGELLYEKYFFGYIRELNREHTCKLSLTLYGNRLVLNELTIDGKKSGRFFCTGNELSAVKEARQ